MPEWLTIAITVIPLAGIAGSAIAYIIRLYQEAGERKHRRFFELLGYLDGDGPIAAKLGAVYQLREFKEHEDFVERFCRKVADNVKGESTAALVDELNRTAEAIAERRK
ncbi:hypothetical protein [Aurantiacibacter suaedae]|uniref:hypothetical protein n=1 Tax=Aurantiacibacter suaedae TaxID=2545755 RepID=UPI0010F5D5A5|nr:hypothetical protein [Aurantiacibacter suaedae]